MNRPSSNISKYGRCHTVLLFTLCASLGMIACSSSDDGLDSQSNKPSGTGGSAGGNGTGASGGQPGIGSDGGIIPMDSSSVSDATMDECAKSTAKASLLPTYLQFVVDISGSMNCRPTDPPDKGCQSGIPNSKWSLTRTALEAAIDLLPSSASAGAILYPGGKGSNQLCFSGQEAVPMALLSNSHKQLFKQVLQSTHPSGATPTEDAYLFAVQSFESVPEPSNKFIILITDGVPTVSKGCKGNGSTPVATGPLVQASADALAKGVKTFVMGSPGSEAVRTPLSEMANKGGTATPGCSDSGPNYCHLDMTTQADFGKAISDALLDIAGKTLSCSFSMPEPEDESVKVDPNLVNVVYSPGGGEPQTIGQSQEVPCLGAGWYYSNDKTQIILCEQTCKTVQADPEAEISIVLGCATEQVK